MYVQTRALEHYLVIGGVVLCFTPLFFSMFIPAVVFYVSIIVGLFSFAIAPQYLRFTSNVETVLFICLFLLCSIVSIFVPYELIRFPLTPLLFFLAIEIAIRNLLFEFMIRKGFNNTIPIIFVQVLYLLLGVSYYCSFFELTFVTLCFLGLSIGITSAILIKRYSFWWQLLLTIVTVYGLFSYKIHQLLDFLLHYCLYLFQIYD